MSIQSVLQWWPVGRLQSLTMPYFKKIIKFKNCTIVYNHIDVFKLFILLLTKDNPYNMHLLKKYVPSPHVFLIVSKLNGGALFYSFDQVVCAQAATAVPILSTLY